MNPPRPMTLLAVLLLGITLAAAAPSAPRGPSTVKEREAAVSGARYLEDNPLAADAPALRESLLKFYGEVPDISVQICYFLGPLQDERHPLFFDLIRQTLISSGAFIIQHPDKSSDDVAVYTAGLEGALKAYEGLVKDHPEGRLPFVDNLLQKRAAGQLEQYVREETPKNCKH